MDAFFLEGAGDWVFGTMLLEMKKMGQEEYSHDLRDQLFGEDFDRWIAPFYSTQAGLEVFLEPSESLGTLQKWEAFASRLKKIVFMDN